MRRAGLLFSLLLLFVLPLVHAQAPLPGLSGKNRIEQFRLLKEKARGLVLSAAKFHRRDHPERIRLLQRALSELQKALELEPKDIEARVFMGEWLSRPEMGVASVRRAVEELQTARKIDRLGSWHYEIAFQLGIAYSHLGRFSEAVSEYDRALALLPGEPDSMLTPTKHQHATMLSNAAEALMAMGKLDGAIRRYHDAEQLDSGTHSALHALGLSVAYDRDGQMQKSRDALKRAIGSDPGLRMYQSDDVFFVPEGDRYYYDGLIAENLGNRDEALNAFKQFVSELPKSPYVVRAKQHIEELQKLPGIPIQEILNAKVRIGLVHFPGDGAEGIDKHRSEDEVGRALTDRMLELRRCYAQGLRRAPKLSGHILLAMIVDPGGGVLLVQLLNSNLSETGPSKSQNSTDSLTTPSSELARCVQSSLQRFRFPAASVGNDENDEFAVPLYFESK